MYGVGVGRPPGADQLPLHHAHHGLDGALAVVRAGEGGEQGRGGRGPRRRNKHKQKATAFSPETREDWIGLPEAAIVHPLCTTAGVISRTPESPANTNKELDGCRRGRVQQAARLDPTGPQTWRKRQNPAGLEFSAKMLMRKTPLKNHFIKKI